jgi:hypothetical protein
LDGGITEEAWTCKKVNYSFLKAFSSEAFVHIDKEIEQNLKKNTSVPLLDMVLMILAIAYGIIKITKSVGV